MRAIERRTERGRERGKWKWNKQIKKKNKTDRQRASQGPEIFGQLGVGKRKSQNKQIVWQNKNYFRNARTLPTSATETDGAYLLHTESTNQRPGHSMAGAAAQMLYSRRRLSITNAFLCDFHKYEDSIRRSHLRREERSKENSGNSLAAVCNSQSQYYLT